MRRLAALVFLVFAACGSIGAQAHTISLGYKAGDTSKYTLHAVLDYKIGAEGFSIPFNLEMTGKETITVKSVDSSGTADITVELSDLTVKTATNGVTNTTTTSTPPSFEMKVASDGRIVGVSGSSFTNGSLPGVSGTGGGLVTAILPDHAVKPGDTWTKDYDQANPMGTGAVHVTSKNKYLRDEQVKSVSTAVVQSNIASNLDLTVDMSAMAGQAGSLLPTGGGAGLQSLSMKGTTTSDVTSWIDTGARRVVKTHSSGTIDATMTLNMAAGATTPGLTGPITFKGTQTTDMNPA
jgi:hypothetical protein